MPIERIQPAGMAKPAAYSQVVRVGNTVYVAGQTSTNEQGQLVGVGDIRAQAVQVYENLKKALAAVDGTLENLVKITVYVTDARYRDAVAEVRTEYLGGTVPASTLVVVAGLARPEFLLEIEGVAVVD
jgi:enamine deaminase RidA (YjgF/YER057c/UK114 family)